MATVQSKKRIFLPLVVLLFSALFTKVISTPCVEVSPKDVRLQIVFLQDRTFSFIHFPEKLAAVVPDMIASIKTEFPHAEFAFTSFADYPNESRPKRRAPPNEDSCYDGGHPFTTDPAPLQDALHKMPIISGGDNWEESSLSALTLAASDPKFGWIRCPQDENSLHVRRLLIFITDDHGVVTLGVPGTRHTAYGNSSDSCRTTLPPTPQVLRRVLRKHDITSVIGMLVTTHHRGDPTQWYEDYFKRAAFPFSSFIFDKEHPETLSGKIKIALKTSLECHHQCTIKDSRLQTVFLQDRTGSFRKVAPVFAGIVPNVIKAIQKKLPTAEFALTTFADYPMETEGRILLLPPGEDDCYTLNQQLTTDPEVIQKAIANITHVSGGKNYPESSLTAAVLAASDLNMGWVRTLKDPEGKTVHRILIIVTDEKGITFLQNPGDRVEPMGDGSDNCRNSLPPTPEVMGRILKMHEITAVIGLLFRMQDMPFYRDFFREAGVEFIHVHFDTDYPKTAAKKVENAILKVFGCPDEELLC